MLGWSRKSEAELTPEQRQLIARGEALVTQTRQRVKAEGTGNLTSSWMLRDDCQAAEQLMKKLTKSPDPDTQHKLKDALIRLQTTSENILQWTFHDTEDSEV